METVKEFTPVLMYRDTERIEAITKGVDNTISNLKESVIISEHVLDKQFNLEEKKNFLEQGLNYVLNELKAKFQFPNATFEFNMQALGKDIEPHKSRLASVPSLFKSYAFKVTEDDIVLSQKSKNEIIKAGSFFTENEKQNEAFEIAKRLCADLNKIHDLGYIDKSDFTHIEQGNKLLLKAGWQNPKIIPNYKGIQLINERGGIVNIYD